MVRKGYFQIFNYTYPLIALVYIHIHNTYEEASIGIYVSLVHYSKMHNIKISIYFNFLYNFNAVSYQKECLRCVRYRNLSKLILFDGC